MNEFLDNHGQPPITFNFADNERKAINTLHGILIGLTADGIINDDEVHGLKLWLLNNAAYAKSYPLSAVKENIDAILADGSITQSERNHLCTRLIEIIGGSYAETGVMGGLSTTYKFDEPEKITFKKNKFCISGTFSGQTRKDVEYLITTKGGVIQGNITLSLDYLVVGSGASRDWVGGAHGRKIDTAYKLREQGGKVKIIAEGTFFKLYEWE